jgi:hypothetical protein
MANFKPWLRMVMNKNIKNALTILSANASLFENIAIVALQIACIIVSV